MIVAVKKKLLTNSTLTDIHMNKEYVSTHVSTLSFNFLIYYDRTNSSFSNALIICTPLHTFFL